MKATMNDDQDIRCNSTDESLCPQHQGSWNISSPPFLVNLSMNGSVSENEAASDEEAPSFQLYNWRQYKSELTWAFPVHIYAFACLFFMLSFYTFFSILNLRSQLSTRPFMSTINVFVCVLGISRATCFLIDPYYSHKVFPGILGWVLWDVGYPCILSAFGLIQLAFSQLTQMTFRPESLRKKSSLSIIIAVHFLCILGSNIVAAFEHQLQAARIVVQIVFLSWGIVLCITFLYGGGKILQLLKTLPNSAFQNSEPVSEHKGILQLALLAQCNNIASSVINSAAPSTVHAPKIKVTDENEVSISAGESNQKVKVPEINITSVESPNPAESSPKDKTFNQPFVKIEICEATPETPEEKYIDGESSKLDIEDTSNSRRKKSLSWVDESDEIFQDMLTPSTSKGCAGATLGCEISQGERRRRRSSDSSSRRSSNVSISSSRKNSGSWDSMSRKGSCCSVSSFKQGGVYPDVPSRKGSHVGEALVLSRRGSLCSDVSSRRGSGQILTSTCSSRRGSHRSIKDEVEGESLLKRPSDAGDVTLSSILNHIAYVNQTNASKVGVKVKESRKEQVRQVLIVTYVTAILGMSLSLLLVLGFYTHPPPSALVPPWVWFVYESACRLLEFLIGCAMANITRQPVNRHSQYGYNLRMKARNSIYM